MTMGCVLALEENPEDVYLETSSLLLKLVDNIIKNPSNPKYRSIRLSNPTVANKLLPAVGAMECLFEMGFQEVSTASDSYLLGYELHFPFSFLAFCVRYLNLLINDVTKATYFGDLYHNLKEFLRISI
jgi:hypothetical protein